MSRWSSLEYRIATQDIEFEAVHRLNYKTFVEEIPQRHSNDERRLVDKFHGNNTYLLCYDGSVLAGMIAGCMLRPFSLDSKVPDLDSFLPRGRKLVEIRLLATEKPYRNGPICSRLVGGIAEHFIHQGANMGLISATVRQLKLYQHLGCVPFGSLVGSPEALFQPMYVTLENFIQNARAIKMK